MIMQDLQHKAIRAIKKSDPVLSDLIKKVGVLEWKFGGNYFLDLASSIVQQQLSIKAGDTIWKRFIALFPENHPTADLVFAIEGQKIRDAGISWSKVSYVKDLAEKTLESGIVFEQFSIMTDEEIITELVKVKGIGRWTGEMFLMFTMGRPDVFSYGDLGLRRAIQHLYQLKKEPTKEEAEKIAEKWKPYRTIACRYLWRSLEM